VTIIPQKRCSKCGEVKPTSEFARSKIHSDGYYSSCKACKSAYTKAFAAANREHVRAQKRASQAKYAEKHRADGRAYYAANRERVIERTAAYQRAHPEQARAYQRAARVRHRDRYLPKVRERSAAWREQNREKDRAASKRWRDENRDAFRAIQHRRRARLRGSEGSYTAEEWQELKARYNHRCLCCGRQEPEIVLTVDHVVPIALGGANVIANLQPLCLSCNCSKQDTIADYR
jgi:5-methylcytosine-specific restriction endonuclease McrA